MWGSRAGDRPGGLSHQSAGAGFGTDDVTGVAAVKPVDQAPLYAGRSGLQTEYERAPSEASAGQTRARRAGFHGDIDQTIERFATNFQAVAEAGVRFLQQAAEGFGIGTLHGLHAGVDARRFAGYVRGGAGAVAGGVIALAGRTRFFDADQAVRGEESPVWRNGHVAHCNGTETDQRRAAFF